MISDGLAHYMRRIRNACVISERACSCPLDKQMVGDLHALQENTRTHAHTVLRKYFDVGNNAVALYQIVGNAIYIKTVNTEL